MEHFRDNDARELTNLANSPEHAKIKTSLLGRLPATTLARDGNAYRVPQYEASLLRRGKDEATN